MECMEKTLVWKKEILLFINFVLRIVLKLSLL
jgi:hypothetical protein